MIGSQCIFPWLFTLAFSSVHLWSAHLRHVMKLPCITGIQGSNQHYWYWCVIVDWNVSANVWKGIYFILWQPIWCFQGIIVWSATADAAEVELTTLRVECGAQETLHGKMCFEQHSLSVCLKGDSERDVSKVLQYNPLAYSCLSKMKTVSFCLLLAQLAV